MKTEGTEGTKEENEKGDNEPTKEKDVESYFW
jgi:hypothetical protein